MINKGDTVIAAFVRRMCRFLDIPLYTASIKVNDLRQKHDSLEECARRLRYEFFDSISKDRLIATAHTASDNCETILINMVRGTALSGICGIPAKRDNIIRPLLYNTREDIELYCSETVLIMSQTAPICPMITQETG